MFRFIVPITITVTAYKRSSETSFRRLKTLFNTQKCYCLIKFIYQLFSVMIMALKRKEGFGLEDLFGVPPTDFEGMRWKTGFWISGPCNDILNSQNKATGFSVTGPTGNDLWHFTKDGILDTGYSLTGPTRTDFYFGSERTPYFLIGPLKEICYMVEQN